MYDIVREEDDYSISIVHTIKVKSVLKKHLFFWHSVKMVRRMHIYTIGLDWGRERFLDLALLLLHLDLLCHAKTFILQTNM